MGSQWPGMGRELMCISTFKDTIDRCYNALESEGFDLMSRLHIDDDLIYNDPQNAACPNPGDHKLIANVVAELANTGLIPLLQIACHVAIVATIDVTYLDLVCG